MELPAASAEEVMEGGRPLERVTGITPEGAANGRVEVQVGSDTYRFAVGER